MLSCRALLHATARMISGGPVYVSDKPGAHDPALLARLALPGGLLLQPLLPGRPTRDCLFSDPCRSAEATSFDCCGSIFMRITLLTQAQAAAVSSSYAQCGYHVKPSAGL
jgi:raffinose synthase